MALPSDSSIDLDKLITQGESAEPVSEEDAETLAQEAEEERRQKEEMLESLAISVSSKFLSRAAKRLSKENQWLRSASLYYGKLALDGYYKSSETPFSKGVYTDRPDVNIVRSKCAIAIAQTSSMQFGTSEKNWDLVPYKGETDPKTLEGCIGMSNEIEQQLAVAKYSLQSRKAMLDRVMLGSGIMKGPSSVGKLVKAYDKLQGTTVWVPTLSVDYAPQIVRVNPWFFYPDETTDEFSKVLDTIETHPMSALEIKKLIKHKGFIPDALERVLEKKPEEFRATNWADFAKLSENNPNLYKDKYLVLEYHGPVTRTQLDKLDIEPSYDSVNEEYYGEVWVCQGEIIRVDLEAIEANFSVPYYLSVWEKDPGSVFGFGVPLMMEDSQRVVNEAWHMILDNTSLSSGPQVAMQKHLIEPANGKWEFKPQQIWYLTDPQATIQQAIQFFNVPNVTQQIIPIMDMAQQFSDLESCIPLITAGLASPENSETATGSLMAHQASTTLLDFMSEEWDDNMTAPIIQNMYAWNMQNNPNDAIKGGYKVDVRTSTQFKNKQLHLRDLEKLSVESAQNPNLARWLNQDALTKARLEMMNLPSDAIIKTDEQEAKDAAEAAKQPNPQMMEMELKAKAQQLAEAQLAFKMKQEVQEAAWTHEEKMADVQVRLQEAQGRVAVAQNQKEIAIMELEAKQAQHSATIQSNEKIATVNNQTKAFETGMVEARKQKEADTYDTQVALNAQAQHARLAVDHQVAHTQIASDHALGQAKIKSGKKST